MKCFNHADIDGVSLCKACSKALCHQCFEDIDLGFACKNERCIGRAKLINKMLESNSKVMNVANKQSKAAGLSSAALGVGFLLYAYFSYTEMPNSFLPFFLGTIGGITLVSGILRLQKKQQFPQDTSHNPEK
jgi:hypothetical protein